MASIKKLTIDRFDGGIVTSDRSNSSNAFTDVTQFDVVQDPHKARPVPSFQDWVTEREKEYGLTAIGALPGSSLIYATGNALTNWLAPGWTHRFKVTQAYTRYLGYTIFNFADAPAGFWENVQSQNDVRITNTSHTEIEYDIFDFDMDTKSGYVFIQGTQDFYVYYGNPNASNGEGDPYSWSGAHRFFGFFEGSTQDKVSGSDAMDSMDINEPGLIGRGLAESISSDSADNLGYGGDNDEIVVSFSVNYKNTFPGARTIISGSAWNVQIDANGRFIFFINETSGSFQMQTTNTYNTPNTWYHVDCSYKDGTGVKSITVNGETVVNTSATLEIDYDGTDPLTINGAANCVIDMVDIKDNDYISQETAENYNEDRRRQFEQDNPFSIGIEESFETIDVEYGGIMLFKKDLNPNNTFSDKWYEYSSRKATGYIPEEGQIITTDGNNLWFPTKNNTNDFRYFGFDGGSPAVLDPNQKTLTTTDFSEAAPYAEFGINGKMYVYDGVSNALDSIVDGIYTDDEFSTFSQPVSQAIFGEYIGVVSQKRDESRLQLWDYNDTVATTIVNLGAGVVRVAGTVDGNIVTVLDNFSSEDYKTFLEPSMSVVLWAGGNQTRTLYRFKLNSDDDPSFTRNFDKQVGYLKVPYRNGFLFYAKLNTKENGQKEGLWLMSSNEQTGALSLSLFLDTTALGIVTGINKTGEQLTVAHGRDGSISILTDDVYTTTSSIQTLKIDDDDAVRDKKLKEVSISTEPLKEGQTYSMYYRKDGDNEWIKIFDHTETDSIKKTATLIESSKVALPKFKEIEFKVESVGGDAALTQIQAHYEPLNEDR